MVALSFSSIGIKNSMDVLSTNYWYNIDRYGTMSTDNACQLCLNETII
jgi:hypothetical protein